VAPLFGPLCRSIESCGHWQRLIFVWLVKNSLLHGHVQWCVVAYLSQEPELAIQYDTMRDTVLTCAQKPTLLSVNYRTEPKTKMRKTEKLKKYKKRICSEISVNTRTSTLFVSQSTRHLDHSACFAQLTLTQHTQTTLRATCVGKNHVYALPNAMRANN